MGKFITTQKMANGDLRVLHSGKETDLRIVTRDDGTFGLQWDAPGSSPVWVGGDMAFIKRHARSFLLRAA